MRFKNIKFLIFFIISISVKAEENNYNGYQWTEKHPVLTNYISKYKKRIIEYTPYKIENSKEYIKFIEAFLMKEGIPKEIVVLAAIESGFDPDAISYSEAKATGMWQFTKSTGREWGLKINKDIDERKNWKKSTIAAGRYIKWMANKHFDGNYETAILAYNAGIGNVQKAMKKYDTEDPWELIQYDHFPKENREFLPKFITFMHYFYYLMEKEN